MHRIKNAKNIIESFAFSPGYWSIYYLPFYQIIQRMNTKNFSLRKATVARPVGSRIHAAIMDIADQRWFSWIPAS